MNDEEMGKRGMCVQSTWRSSRVKVNKRDKVAGRVAGRNRLNSLCPHDLLADLHRLDTAGSDKPDVPGLLIHVSLPPPRLLRRHKPTLFSSQFYKNCLDCEITL